MPYRTSCASMAAGNSCHLIRPSKAQFLFCATTNTQRPTMSHLNTPVQFAATFGRLPITTLRLALVLALTMLAQGAMAQAATPAPVKPRAATVDGVDATPGAIPAFARERAPVQKAVTPTPALAPQSVSPTLEVPRTPEELMPLPIEGRGSQAQERARARTLVPEPSAAPPVSAPVAPTREGKQH